MERPSRNTLIRYFRGQCAPYEIKLIRLYLSLDTDREFVASCQKEAWLSDQEENGPEITDADVKSFSERFFERQRTLPQQPPLDQVKGQRSFRFPAWWKAVAAALILVGAIPLVVLKFTSKPVDTHLAEQKYDVLPGSDKALLTLSDGSTVSLSDAAEGKIAELDGLRIEKTGEGEIAYRGDKKASSNAKVFNSVVTPNGGQYRVVLPDGSKAWLNAASSLVYPVSFSDDERRVKMTGEVYFEIAKVTNHRNRRVPFFVETDKQEIQVLGTHFNVNAYMDEPYSSTTLVEGSIKVTAVISGRSVLLKPGQQANLSDDLKVVAADMEQQLAWKNGDFVFNQEPLSSVLRKVSRWYDVEVVCPAELGEIQLSGMISRNQPLSDVLKSISSIGRAKITLKERRLVVEQ